MECRPHIPWGRCRSSREDICTCHCTASPYLLPPPCNLTLLSTLGGLQGNLQKKKDPGRREQLSSPSQTDYGCWEEKEAIGWGLGQKRLRCRLVVKGLSPRLTLQAGRILLDQLATQTHSPSAFNWSVFIPTEKLKEICNEHPMHPSPRSSLSPSLSRERDEGREEMQEGGRERIIEV